MLKREKCNKYSPISNPRTGLINPLFIAGKLEAIDSLMKFVKTRFQFHVLILARLGTRRNIRGASVRGMTENHTQSSRISGFLTKRFGRWLTVGALAIAVLGAGLPAPSWAKYASIVVDAKTGEILHATNADTRNYPASLTKMMTLFLVFEALETRK